MRRRSRPVASTTSRSTRCGCGTAPSGRRTRPTCCPAWVAEMDFALAPPMREALLAGGRARRHRLRRTAAELRRGVRGLRRRAGFGWAVEPERVALVADVMSGVAELLRVLTEPGDGDRRQPARLPAVLRRSSATSGGRSSRCRSRGPRTAPGARPRRRSSGRSPPARAAYLLCNPHNPTGHVLARERARGGRGARRALRRDRDLGRDPRADDARRARRTSRTSRSAARAAEHGLTLTGASKAWNIAGLKCARRRRRLGRDAGRSSRRSCRRTSAVPRRPLRRARVDRRVRATAATWLDALVAHLDRNRRLLAELLADAAARRSRYVAARGRATSPGSTAASSASATTPPRPSSSAGGWRSARGRGSGSRGAGYRAPELRHLGRAARGGGPPDGGERRSLTSAFGTPREANSDYRRAARDSDRAQRRRSGPTCRPWPNAACAASSTLPRRPGFVSASPRRSGSRGIARPRVRGQAAVRDRVDDELLKVDGTPRSPSLLRQLADEPAVDDRAEDRDGEDAAELAARVHGRGRHPGPLGRHDREHRRSDRDEREPEAEPDDGERGRERPERRRPASRSASTPNMPPPASRQPAAIGAARAPRPPSSAPATRPGDDHRDRHRDELERDLPARRTSRRSAGRAR